MNGCGMPSIALDKIKKKNWKWKVTALIYEDAAKWKHINYMIYWLTWLMLFNYESCKWIGNRIISEVTPSFPLAPPHHWRTNNGGLQYSTFACIYLFIYWAYAACEGDTFQYTYRSVRMALACVWGEDRSCFVGCRWRKQ